MVDNYKQIRELLHWRSEDDFYFLQILQRKKDHKKGKVNGCNNNSRSIKFYYIKSLDEFDFIKPEVIELCKLFNARASINLNRRSFEKTAMQHLKKAIDQVMNGDHRKAYKAYSTVVGEYQHENDKRWVLDIDYEDYRSPKKLAIGVVSIAEFIKTIRPAGDKIIANVPSKSGYHLITKPFDLQEFNKVFPKIEVHKNNPTNLYIP